MKFYEALAEAPALEGRTVALGTFDGVHLGHRRVIEKAIEEARRHGLSACVVTFNPHPAQLLRPQTAPKLISNLPIKVSRVSQLGADELLAIPFTREFSELTADQFCDDVLVGTLGARFVSVGENFHFGHGAEGNPELLRRHPEFTTDVVGLVSYEGVPVSSTRIRGLLEAGDVERANALLGSPFALEQVVVRGDGRGRELKMPTANLIPDPAFVIPAPGVYAATARAGEMDIGAAVNVGVRPTFEENGRLLVEAHLIGFDGDLYGETLRVCFLKRLRDERRFDSRKALIEQMKLDVAESERVSHGVEIG